MNGPLSARTARQRWSTASELLRLVHAEPGLTRTEARERLSLASGAATELVERLRDAHLLAEHRVPRSGPGRPTSVLDAHPEGPLAVIVDLRSADWQVLTGDLAGRLTVHAGGTYERQAPADFLPRIARHVADSVEHHQGRVRAIAAVVAGTVSGTRLLQFATRGWNEADLAVLTRDLPPGSGVPLLTGNDATLGGLAETRTGAARGAAAALHVLVAVGVGGALFLAGRPVDGAHGAGGEYGHLPFGDPALACPCGAHGCWDLMVDGRALARLLGDDEPDDPIAYARRVLDAVRAGHATGAERDAVATTAAALGAGIAGLVNLHDPDVVTLAGLAPALRAAASEAFETSLRDGLTTFHRQSPPPLRDSLHSEGGSALGALSLAVDEITSPAALARWDARTALG